MATMPEASIGPDRETSVVRTLAIPPGAIAVASIGLAATALIKFDLSGRAFVAAAFCAVLVVLAAIDLQHRIIPNRIVVPAAAVVLLGDIAAQPHRAKEWAIAAFATGGGALILAVASRGGIGMGDVKLAFLLGAGLGYAVLGGLVLAMAATFVVSVAILVRRGLGARKEMIPFGPFLALGAILALFLS
jgi:prepilin signal peptidase PulO-like enzyme (type II secretory pathway)